MIGYPKTTKLDGIKNLGDARGVFRTHGTNVAETKCVAMHARVKP